MQSTLYLRIVILSMEPGAWCDWCGVPSASTVSYVLEPAAAAARRLCGPSPIAKRARARDLTAATGCQARLSRSRSSRRPACECSDNGRGKCLEVTTALSARNVRAVLGHLRQLRDAVPGPTGRWWPRPGRPRSFRDDTNLQKPATKDRQATAVMDSGRVIAGLFFQSPLGDVSHIEGRNAAELSQPGA